MEKIRKIDLHMHSTVSDGTDTPEEILGHVREAGLDLFALTDHDAIRGCAVIRDLLGPEDPKFLCGAEFSCKDEDGKYHILGYQYDPESEAIRSLLDKGQQFRMVKLEARLNYLKDMYNITFPEEELAALRARDNPGKPHIAALLVAHGYAESIHQGIQEYLDGAPSHNQYVRPEEAIRGILGGGGIPVLAHAPYGSGEELIVGKELDQRLHKLVDFGLQGVEAFYSGFSPKLVAEMLLLAKKYDLYVTAGSDYHGKNKLIPLGDTNMGPLPILPEGMKRFLERALGEA